MEIYKTTDHTPPTPSYCSQERQNRLKEAGFTTDGHIDHLRQIITENGFKLPSQDGEHYGFIFQQKYTRLYLSMVEAMAEEVLMLREFGAI